MLFRAKIELDLDAIATTSSHAGDAQNPDRWMLHQAANDGFRGVLLMCFDGPDADSGPRGLVVLANGDNQAMLLVAAYALRRSNLSAHSPAYALKQARSTPALRTG